MLDALRRIMAQEDEGRKKKDFWDLSNQPEWEIHAL